MNYKSMLNLYPEQTKKSTIKEINTILDRNTIEGVLFQDIHEDKRIIYIMWGAKRSQPSILFNVTSLATMCKRANEQDFGDVNHLLEYINEHKDDFIRLKIDGKVQLSVFVDSSASLYFDGKGHGGHVISLGSNYSGPIEVCSNKSRLVGRSSMEYELFALHNMLPSLLFLKDFLEELGYKQEPIRFSKITNV
jgi:hypothetical protein